MRCRRITARTMARATARKSGVHCGAVGKSRSDKSSAFAPQEDQRRTGPHLFRRPCRRISFRRYYIVIAVINIVVFFLFMRSLGSRPAAARSLFSRRNPARVCSATVASRSARDRAVVSPVKIAFHTHLSRATPTDRPAAAANVSDRGEERRSEIIARRVPRNVLRKQDYPRRAFPGRAYEYRRSEGGGGGGWESRKEYFSNVF